MPVISVRTRPARSVQAVLADRVGGSEPADPRERAGRRWSRPARAAARRRPGASGTEIVTASKCERTSIALMWWTGMSSVAPIAAALLDRRQDRHAADRGLASGAPNFGWSTAATCSSSPCSPTIPPLPYASTGLAERLLAAAHQLVAEVLAEVDELARGPPTTGRRTGSEHDDRDGDAAERPLELALAVGQDLLAERHPLADRDRHGCLLRPVRSSRAKYAKTGRADGSAPVGLSRCASASPSSGRGDHSGVPRQRRSPGRLRRSRRSSRSPSSSSIQPHGKTTRRRRR